MEEVEKLIQKMSALTNPMIMSSILEQAFDRMEDELADAQTEQMYRGENADGSQIQPAYTRFTVRAKRAKGQIADHVTLKDTGKFYRATKAKTAPNAIEIINTDKKKDELVEKYSDKVFGYNEKTLLLLQPKTIENTQFELQRYFQL